MSATSATFYVTGGTLRYDAPSYVEREADRELLEGLQQGEFCYVLTSRQMGKSSLMVRTANKLRAQGLRVVVLDLTAIGQNLTPEQWYDGMAMQMGRQLQLEDEVETYWTGHVQLGPCQRFFAAIRDTILPALQRRASVPPALPAGEPPPSAGESSTVSPASDSLVIFVDEIDVVRNLPFSTDEFFAATRECYNRRAQDPELNRVTFCLLGVATPSDLIRDTRLTPFNIGQRIELNDFTADEAAPLAEGFENPNFKIDTRTALLERILHWTGGHPYLTQRLCRALAESDWHGNSRSPSLVSGRFIDKLCEGLFFSSQARERDDNLIFVRERLLRAEIDLVSLLEEYLKVRSGRKVLDDDTSALVSVLKLSGIVKSEEGWLRERNRIYSNVFDREWVRTHMPDADLRRQRAAFQRGVVRTTAIAAVVVAAMTVMVVIAASERERARRALAQSYFSQAQARRVSGVSGQRDESLDALRKARLYYTNEAQLRDEVIACLALADLKDATDRTDSLAQTNVFELNPDHGVSATAYADGSITLRKGKYGRLLRTLPGSGLPVERLRFAPHQPVVLASYWGGTQQEILVWNWENGQKLFKITNSVHAAAIDFSPDGRKLAVGRADGRVFVYSVTNGAILHSLELRLVSGLPRPAQVIRFSPSGDFIAESCLFDSYVQIWELCRTSPIARLFHSAAVYDIAWHPGGELVATACGDACVYIWDINRPERYMKKLAGHEEGVSAVAFDHRGGLLASLGLDETVRLWVPATARQMARRLEGESFDRLRFSADDQLLIATGNPQTNSRAWEVLGGEYVALPVHTGPVGSIDFSPDSRWLVAVEGERVTIWDSLSRRELGVLKFSFANSYATWFAPDSQHLLSSAADGLFSSELVRRGDGSQSRFDTGMAQRLNQVKSELRAMAVTTDRSMAAIVHQEEVLLVPLVPQGTRRMRTIPVGSHYHHLALHPFGAWMATMVDHSDSLHLWSLSETVKAPSPDKIPSSEYFVFSPDGKWLVTCWAGEFKFYRVGMWQKPEFPITRKVASHQQAPSAFTQDGSVAALASSRYTIQLWRLPEGGDIQPKLIATLESPDRSPLEMLAFSPDGRQLAAGTKDQIIQLWNLASLRKTLAEFELHSEYP